MKSEMKKYSGIIVAFAVFIFIATLPLAFGQESGQGSGGSGAVKIPGTYKDLGAADNRTIEAATNYVKQKLGEDYFNMFIRFVSGISYETCIQNDCAIKNEITFNYNKQDLPTREHLITKVTVDDNYNILSYFGPAKPYKFLLTESDAINAAKAYGLKNITAAGITKSSDNEYELVWFVASHDLVAECNGDAEYMYLHCTYKGVYVDIDSGEIRGEYTINPSILAPSEGVILNKPAREEKSPENKEEILVNAEEQAQTKNVQDTQTQSQKEQKIGFFRKIINWLKGLFS